MRVFMLGLVGLVVMAISLNAVQVDRVADNMQPDPQVALFDEIDRYWRAQAAGAPGDYLAAHRAYIAEQAAALPEGEVPAPVRLFLDGAL